MIDLLIFTGVPLDDNATLYRSGFLAKKLQEEGYSVKVASVDKNFKKIETRLVENLPVKFLGQAHYYSQNKFSDRQKLGMKRVIFENMRTCWRFIKLVRQEKPERVLVVTTMPISLMIGFASKLLGCDTFLDIEDYAQGQMEASGYNQSLVKIYDFVEKLFLPLFNKVCVCSHFLQEKYPGSMIIPNMIDIDFWAGPKKKKSQIINLVFVGQMGPYHGQREVLESLAPVLKRNQNLKLIFVGGGEYLNKLKIKNEKLKMKKQVIFTGQVAQEKVREILAASDIGILPLWDKPVHKARHPLKLIEYLAAGLVVVANAVGEARLIIKEGENGLLLPAGDLTGLGQTIEKIINDPQKMNNISAKAIETASQFSTEEIMPKWQYFLQIK
jgi:glycosyltransferase involved in cell wall biosynthesis